MQIEAEGLAKLRRELKAIDAALVKELNKIGKDAAGIVAEMTRSIAPVVTGELRDSVTTGVMQGGGVVKVGRGAPYANAIVYGWAKHGISPDPFPYEALDARRDEVIERYETGLHDLIEKTITPGVT